MTARLQAATVIDRPVSTVFWFYAENHVQNHPRWDPDIELWKTSDGPMAVGTIIRRRNSRSGTPVDGTMEVTEYEPDRVLGMRILDGPAEILGRTTFEAAGEGQTIMKTFLDIPGMDDSTDTSFLNSRLERSGLNIKRLIESETQRD